MRYFEKCVTSGSCLHLTVQKSRLWSYQKVIRLSSLIQSKLLEIIVDYIRGEQLQKINASAQPPYSYRCVKEHSICRALRLVVASSPIVLHNAQICSLEPVGPACRTAEWPRQKQAGQVPSGNRGAARQILACQARKLNEETRNQETEAVKSYGGFCTFEPLGPTYCEVYIA